MKKTVSSVLFIITWPLRLLKKSKVDNFVAGLIFGSLFSLFVNIITVKVQEDVNKQRVLESLEREITFHILTANTIINEFVRINEISDEKYNSEYIVSDSVIKKRFTTKTWDTTEANKYLLEVDPDIAGKIEGYYSTVIPSLNLLMDSNEEYYQELYKQCHPLYNITTSKPRELPLYCNTINEYSIRLQKDVASNVLNYIKDIKQSFHPTRNRLNSVWLKLLLGNKSVEILK